MHDGLPAWVVERDMRCQRGLMFVYRLSAPSCRACLFAAIDATWPTMAANVEQLGAVRVDVRALAFNFELRVGLRGPDVELIHRFSSSEVERERAHAGLEAALQRAVACGRLGRCAHG